MNNKHVKYKTITAPASKSYLQRALAISSLTKGVSILTNISWCDDSISAKNIIKKLGSDVVEKDRDLTIKSKGINFKNTDFFAGESGLCIRMFSPVLALSEKEVVFTGKGTLLNRPINIIADALTQLSVIVETNNGFLPIKIKGKIKSGNIFIDGSISSQLLTGLLITLPLLDGNSEIIVKNLKSTPYIDMTLSIIKEFGVEIENIDYQIFRIKTNQKYKPRIYNIEGDWSGSAFFLVLGAVNGKIKINNLCYNSLQADKKIIDVLKKAGADIVLNDNSVLVQKNKLKNFDFDATDCPDLFPPIACLASQCEGTSTIKGVSRLIYKESNRAKVLLQEFANVGIEIKIDGDFMQITGGKLKTGTINSNNDHRIAMMAGVLDKICNEEINVINKETVNKSYPDFFKILKEI